MDKFGIELDYLLNERHLIPMLYNYYNSIEILHNHWDFKSNDFIYRWGNSDRKFDFTYKETYTSKLERIRNSNILFQIIEDPCNSRLNIINLDYFDETNIMENGIFLTLDGYIIEVDGNVITAFDLINPWLSLGAEPSQHLTKQDNIIITLDEYGDLIHSKCRFKFKPNIIELLKIE